MVYYTQGYMGDILKYLLLNDLLLSKDKALVINILLQIFNVNRVISYVWLRLHFLLV